MCLAFFLLRVLTIFCNITGTMIAIRDESAMNFEGVSVFLLTFFIVFRNCLRTGSKFRRERSFAVSQDLSSIGPVEWARPTGGIIYPSGTTRKPSWSLSSSVKRVTS
jgi:hypothetical protein